MKTSLHRKTLSRGLAAGLILFLFAAGALYAADVVRFRDGRVLEGRVVAEGETTITFRRDEGEPFTIHRGLIAAIDYARRPDEAEAVEFLAGGAYLRRVREAFQSAERSIKVMMYFAYRTDHPRNPANILLRELRDASRRGVDVKLILERSHVEIINEGNFNSAEWMHQNDMDVLIFPTFPVMHTKLILIDDEISVVGSHNWTSAAIYQNSESSALVRCRRTAERFRDYFAQAELRSTPYREIRHQVKGDERD